MTRTAAQLIAPYIDPSPQAYLKLARVSREFYDAFMSDSVWGKLDVYCVETGISRHYLRIKRRMSTVELEFCANFSPRSGQYPDVDLQTFSAFSLYTQAFVLVEPFKKRSGLYNAVASREAFLYAGAKRDALYYSSRVLRGDHEFMENMIALNPRNFVYASEDLKDSQHLAVLAARGGYAHVLEVASQRLRHCRETVAEIVAIDGLEIQWASDKLKGDPEVAWLAVKSNPAAFQFCALEMRGDLNLAKYACSRIGGMLEFAGPAREDEELAMGALKQDLGAFEHAPQHLKDKIVAAAIV